MILRRAFGYAPSRFYNAKIEPQLWSAAFSPLDNSIAELLSDENKLSVVQRKEFLRQAVAENDSKFLFYRKGKVAVDHPEHSLAWRDYATVEKLGLKFFETQEKAESGNAVFVILGKRKDGAPVEGDKYLRQPGWRFAVDVSDMEEADLLATLESGKEVHADSTDFIDARRLIPMLDHATLSVLGQVVARLSWHQEVQFSTRSGNKVYPTGGGHRKQDLAEKNTRKAISYPRTDPVAIMLVESPCGKKCLLGRTKRRHNVNMYSCLAGFVEQGESVEDAVRREVAEESGIVVAKDIRLVGTQPWPLGASGHSELMIGCIARAESTQINMDEDEMDDVRWFSKEDVLEMLHRSKQPHAVGDAASKPLIVPPPFAIAHHLIKAWANKPSPYRIKSNMLALSITASTLGFLLGILVSKL